ncbi:MAG: HEAT repeat domain-containing protein [Planctomycetes bacterium]|nr:HEAT repeat domain-containing protein [Planctomycetota bacterium]
MNSIHKHLLKYFFFVVIIFGTPSVASACSHCINDPLLWVFPSALFAFPFYIIWLIILTIFVFIYKRPDADVAQTSYPIKHNILKSWLLVLLLVWMWQVYMFPSLIISIIWIIYLIRQWVKGAKIKEQSKEGLIFLKLHRATLIILLVLGVGIFIFSRTPPGLMLYFKEGVQYAKQSFSNEEVVKLLEHKDDDIRWQAIIELDLYRNREEIKRFASDIARALGDKDRSVRIFSAELLGKLKVRETLEPLKKQLLIEKDESVRRNIQEAIYDIDAAENNH